MRDNAGVMTMKYFAYGSNMDEDVMQAQTSGSLSLIIVKSGVAPRAGR
jgi:hypothetical protein